MNNLTIIGRLTGDPELRTTTQGKEVCSFNVAVNRRIRDNREEVDYFKVSAWGEKGKVCKKYLSKGKKVCVTGAVSARAYTNSRGEPAASLEVMADEVEFLSPRDGRDELPV